MKYLTTVILFILPHGFTTVYVLAKKKKILKNRKSYNSYWNVLIAWGWRVLKWFALSVRCSIEIAIRWG